MKITLLHTGKTTEQYISEGLSIYSGRIKRYCTFEMLTVPDIKNTSNMPPEEQKIKEGKKILEHTGPGDYIVLLDERGRSFTTMGFASWLEAKISGPVKKIIFITGGAWGFSEEVYLRAAEKISLSDMTFPHQLVRLLFVEQLYRAFTVINGIPYHHE